MKRPYSALFSLLICLGLLLPQNLSAADQPFWADFWGRQQQIPVDLNAGDLSFDEQNQLYQASGGVTLSQGELALQADSLRWQAGSQTAQARGGVSFETPYSLVSAEEIDISLATGLGRIHQGRVMVKQRPFVLAGELIEKLEGETYHMERGSFTTCRDDPPAWKFQVEDAEVYPDAGYAKGRGAVFYARSVPLLYTPWFFAPIGQERKSGFLLPTFGYSQKRGTEISVPVYWVIARNQDVTFTLDYYSRLGLGKGLEYRYLFPGENRGVLNLYHVGGIKGGNDRYAVSLKQAGSIFSNWRLTADLEYVSGQEFFEDFGDAAEEYTRDQTRSLLTLSRNRQGQVWTGQFKHLRNLESENDVTLQRLPEIQHDLLPRPVLEDHMFLEWNASLTNFWREVGEKGARLTWRPALWSILRPGKLFSIRPELALTSRSYSVSETDPATQTDLMAEFLLQSQTRLARSYGTAIPGWDGFRHWIEPEFNFHWRPRHDQSSLPIFDSTDRLPPRQRLGYRLVNRLYGKRHYSGAAAQFPEVLYLALSQQYEFADLTTEELATEGWRGKLSPLRAEFDLRPADKYYLSADVGYEFHSSQQGWDWALLETGYDDSRGNLFAVDFSYQNDAQNYIGGKADLALFNPLYLHLEQRYDFVANQSYESFLQTEYRGSCWSVRFSYRNRPSNREYMLSFRLTGLGDEIGVSRNIGDSDAESSWWPF